MGEKSDFSSSSHVAKYKATHNLKHYQTGKAFRNDMKYKYCSFVPGAHMGGGREKVYLKKYVKLGAGKVWKRGHVRARLW